MDEARKSMINSITSSIGSTSVDSALVSAIDSIKSDALGNAFAESIRSSDVKNALELVTDSIKSNAVQSVMALINDSIISGYRELPSYQQSFDQAIKAAADIDIQIRRPSGISDLRFIPPKAQNEIKVNSETEIKRLSNILEERDSQIALLQTSSAVLSSSMANLKRQNEIGHILQRINHKTHPQIISGNNELIERLIPSISTKAFLLSIDIRRSTDLMLNAKDASKFAKFLNELSGGLANIVKEHFGIFDKFTGDGALAFFTESFSGRSAALSVLVVARNAHAFFEAHYKAFRSSFNSVLVETGLGIGIDYGDVNILRLSDGLTAVGKPVVYACRLSGAEAGMTLVNQGAFEMMRTADGALEFEEVHIDIKHQGKHLAYRPKNSPRSELIKEPDWFSASPASVE